MPLETLDQTVRKGKCRRYEVSGIHHTSTLQVHFAELLTPEQEGPVRLRPCNPTVLDVFTNFVKQRTCRANPVRHRNLVHFTLNSETDAASSTSW